MLAQHEGFFFLPIDNNRRIGWLEHARVFEEGRSCKLGALWCVSLRLRDNVVVDFE